jgi:hypothetical protein
MQLAFRFRSFLGLGMRYQETQPCDRPRCTPPVKNVSGHFHDNKVTASRVGYRGFCDIETHRCRPTFERYVSLCNEIVVTLDIPESSGKSLACEVIEGPRGFLAIAGNPVFCGTTAGTPKTPRALLLTSKTSYEMVDHDELLRHSTSCYSLKIQAKWTPSRCRVRQSVRREIATCRGRSLQAIQSPVSALALIGRALVCWLQGRGL